MGRVDGLLASIQPKTMAMSNNSSSSSTFSTAMTTAVNIAVNSTTDFGSGSPFPREEPVLGYWSSSASATSIPSPTNPNNNNITSFIVDSSPGCGGDLAVYTNCTNDSSLLAMPENDTDGGQQWYMSSLGVLLAVPEWEAALTATVLSLIIVLTLVGNALVILSVFTYRPLRSAPNFFIVSLAVADMTVAILVLPLNVAYSILGRWMLGKLVCEFWVTSDVLCCTGTVNSSIFITTHYND